MEHSPLDTARAEPAVAVLVAWLAELGVTEFVEERPRDRFAETQAEAEARSGRRVLPNAAPPAAAPAPAVVSRTPAPSTAPSVPAAPPANVPAYDGTLSEAEALDEANARSREAGTLDELRTALDGFTGCGLRLTARSLVFGSGSANADLMFVGEAPGREEDETGSPFVGRQGRLLDAMLAAIGRTRETVRLANTVPWRPPGDRSPTPSEAAICLPFILRQIELVKPQVLVCLDAPSVRALLGQDADIMRLRGKWSELQLGEDAPITATATLHPSHLLRHPGQKHLAWRDLLAIASRLREAALA